jgi:hydroxymethylpyrimidine/phosphomethylpyrimidine kinase
MYEVTKPRFLSLLKGHLDLISLIAPNWRCAKLFMKLHFNHRQELKKVEAKNTVKGNKAVLVKSKVLKQPFL